MKKSNTISQGEALGYLINGFVTGAKRKKKSAIVISFVAEPSPSGLEGSIISVPQGEYKVKS